MLLISGSKILPTTWRFYHSPLANATVGQVFFKRYKDLLPSVDSGRLHLAFAGNVPK
jgi:hypothetical protein